MVKVTNQTIFHLNKGRNSVKKKILDDKDVDIGLAKIDTSKGECKKAQKSKGMKISLELLQVLQEKGFMDEIELCGDLVNGDLLRSAAEEDNFKELENVIDKLWGRPVIVIVLGLTCVL